MASHGWPASFIGQRTCWPWPAYGWPSWGLGWSDQDGQIVLEMVARQLVKTLPRKLAGQWSAMVNPCVAGSGKPLTSQCWPWTGTGWPWSAMANRLWPNATMLDLANESDLANQFWQTNPAIATRPCLISARRKSWTTLSRKTPHSHQSQLTWH